MNHQQIRKELSRAEATLQQHTAHIEKLRKMLETQEGCWKPQEYEAYYFLYSDGEVGSEKMTNDEFDIAIIAIGHCFPTKEAAELHVKRLKVIQKLKELAGGHKPDWSRNGDGYMLVYNHSAGHWYSSKLGGRQQETFVLPYFETEALAQAAITTLGDELNCLIEGV